MRSKPKVYDLIVSEPSNPWIKGVGNLYTTDFYRSCLRRLTPGGILCQWLQTYELSQETLKMAINSFRKVFPYCQLWFNPPSNAMILGSKQPFVFNFTRIESRINYNDFIKQEIKRILAIDIPLDCLVYFELNNSEMTELTQGASLNTDDYPRLEFLAPYNLTMNTVIPNHELIRSYKREILPPNIRLANTKKIFPEDYYYRLSQVYLKVGLDRRINQYIHWAYDCIDMALKMNDQYARFYVVRGRINTAREAFREAEKDFNRSLELDPLNYEPYLELGYLFEKQKKWAEAQSYYQQALKRAPQNSKIHIDYANFLDAKEKQQLFQSMDRELYFPKEL
jgi:tetratricopeptide (TPR) repeat protein